MSEARGSGRGWMMAVAVAGCLGLGVVSVGIAGVLAAIGIPNFVAYQNKAKRTELDLNVSSIVAAELLYLAAFDEVLACGSRDEAERLVGREPRPWSSHPARGCFDELGWRPDVDPRGAYWIEKTRGRDGRPAFTVYGVSDVDGNGELAEVRGDADGSVERVTGGRVY